MASLHAALEKAEAWLYNPERTGSGPLWTSRSGGFVTLSARHDGDGNEKPQLEHRVYLIKIQNEVPNGRAPPRVLVASLTKSYY